jgi:hypothetical protein
MIHSASEIVIYLTYVGSEIFRVSALLLVRTREISSRKS